NKPSSNDVYTIAFSTVSTVGSVANSLYTSTIRPLRSSNTSSTLPVLNESICVCKSVTLDNTYEYEWLCSDSWSAIVAITDLTLGSDEYALIRCAMSVCGPSNVASSPIIFRNA